MRTVATALAVLFSSSAMAVGAAGPAAADSAKTLPVSSYGDLAVDGVHKRVYISDPAGNKIVVTDYTGQVVATVPNLSGVRDLAISPDSGFVYAALPGADAVVAIETVNSTAAARYSTGENTGPQTLAVAGGQVWFTYGQESSRNLGSFDPAQSSPEIVLGRLPGNTWTDAPELESAGNTLVLGFHGTWSGLAVYDVSTGAPVLCKEGTQADARSEMADFALSADGAQIVTTSGTSSYEATAINAADLTGTGGYPIDAYGPDSAAIAPDGTVALAANSPYDKDVFVFKPGATQPFRTYTYGASTPGGDIIAAQGLSWAPDGSRLFAIAQGQGGTYLRVLDDAARYPVTAALSAPARAARGKQLEATGKLTSDKPFPADAKVTVVRTDLDSPKGMSLGTATVAADGAFSFTDTPPAGGDVTYAVHYAGDAAHTAASASAKVDVSRATPSLTLNRNGSTYSYGADVSFTAHLGTTYKNRTVEIWSDPFGADKPKKLLRKGTVDSSGNLSVTVDMTRDTTVTAVFAGDARYAPRSVKSTAYARVKISTSVAKQYKTAKIGSTSYAYFHKKTDPVVTTTMTYYKNRAQKLDLQVYYQGKWYDGGSKYFKLGTDGKSVVTLGGTHETGYRMRLRSSYVNGSSGDTVNSTTHGAWKYFYFTK
ncbi:Ig-like domain repeat protein [Streptomyces sp. NPDC005969]|uniref:Ig-like domain repeat protein n=1 Tax=Streptomyces sp. NPDC005969 TaxID=3156722 RepID=UPI0033CCFFA0